jgi:cytochrome c oxidase subunit 2
VRRKTLLAVGLVALAAVVAACAPNATQDSLDPAGEFARKPHELFVPVFWVAAAIFFVVEGLLLFFVVRYRHRKGRDAIPPQVHGNTRLEIAWTIVPAVILAGVAVPTVATIFDLAREPDRGTMQVDVLGHQWWWEFSYLDEGFTTANELHIPTGEPIYLRLCGVGLAYEDRASPSECQPGEGGAPQPATLGDAVVHSFWVPQLAGTQDVVPGQTNTLWIEADEPGTYTGQCKEFCGLSHAYMRFTVVAHTPQEFQGWLEDQRAAAASPAPDSDAAAGLQVFLEAGRAGCTECHAVDGLQDPATGEPVLGSHNGPNLTHFASRECFAGCMLETTDENLRRWLDNPPAVKAGSYMPDYGLTPEQIDQLIAFLNTLQ